MNQLQERKQSSIARFDYSAVDDTTAKQLKQHEAAMKTSITMAAQVWGRELYEAQQELANHYQGEFGEWYTSLGLNKHDVYDLINQFTFSKNLDNPNQIENFNNAPKMLRLDMVKKSAPEEAKQAALNGDIKSHKEFKEMERRLKAKDAQLSQQKETIASQHKQLLDEQASQDNLQLSLDELKNKMDAEKKKYEALKAEHEKTRRFINNIGEVDGQRSEWARHKADYSVYGLTLKIDNLIKDVKPLSFERDIISNSSEEAKKRINNSLDELDDFSQDLRAMINGRRTINGYAE
jgi:uncharacterized coiled-coil protein SlyX